MWSHSIALTYEADICSAGNVVVQIIYIVVVRLQVSLFYVEFFFHLCFMVSYHVFWHGIIFLLHQHHLELKLAYPEVILVKESPSAPGASAALSKLFINVVHRYTIE